MDLQRLAEAAEPVNLVDYLVGISNIKHEHSDSTISVREDTYGEHKIVIKATYEIKVDEVILQIPFIVGNDGQIYPHGLPHHVFPSFINMIHSIIDHFPEEFTPDRQKLQQDHSGSSTHSDHNI